MSVEFEELAKFRENPSEEMQGECAFFFFFSFLCALW